MPTRLTPRDFALALALVLICAVFSFASPQFLSARNLSLLLIDLSITATLALGMLLVMLPGHIDLSVGSGVGLVGGLAAVLVNGSLPGMTVPPWSAAGAMLFSLAVALVIWWGMGALIVFERIPAFIITLGGMLVLQGVFWLVIQSHTIPVTPPGGAGAGQETWWLHLGTWRQPVWQVRHTAEGVVLVSWLWGASVPVPVLEGNGNLYSLLTTSYLSTPASFALGGLAAGLLAVGQWRSVRQRRAHGLPAPDGELIFLQLFLAAQSIFLTVLITTQYRGVPLPAVILCGVATLVWVITQHTPFGRYLYAIGGNEEAAVLSGVPVRAVSIGAFTLLGGIVALTGLMQTAFEGSSTTTAGEHMELDAVAACVIGGVSLRGGRGTVLGVLFGALIMACMINGMTLLSLLPWQKLVARGAVLILAVWMDLRLSR